MTGALLDVSDPAALAASLEALPEGCWVEVTAGGERHLVVRVPGGWHLPGDMAVASEDVADGRPSRVEVLGDDGHLPAGEAVAAASAEFARARDEQDWDAADVLTRELDDLASAGHAAAGALRDEVDAWLALAGEDPGDVAGCQPW